MSTEVSSQKTDLGSRVSLTGMVTLYLEWKRCQGREAPAGLGLDKAGTEDSLCRAWKAKGGSHRP